MRVVSDWVVSDWVVWVLEQGTRKQWHRHTTHKQSGQDTAVEV